MEKCDLKRADHNSSQVPVSSSSLPLSLQSKRSVTAEQVMQPTYPPRGYAQQQFPGQPQQPNSGGPNAPQYGYPPNAAMNQQQPPRSSPAGPQPGE